MLCAEDNIKEQICAGRNFATRIFSGELLHVSLLRRGQKWQKWGMCGGWWGGLWRVEHLTEAICRNFALSIGSKRAREIWQGEFLRYYLNRYICYPIIL